MAGMLFQFLINVMSTSYAYTRKHKKTIPRETNPTRTTFWTAYEAMQNMYLVGYIYVNLIVSKFNKPKGELLEYMVKQQNEVAFMDSWGIDESQAHYGESIIPKVSEVTSDKKTLVEYLNKLTDYEMDAFSVATQDMKQRIQAGNYNARKNDYVVIEYIEKPSEYVFNDDSDDESSCAFSVLTPPRVGKLYVYPDDKMVYIDSDNKVISLC